MKHLIVCIFMVLATTWSLAMKRMPDSPLDDSMTNGTSNVHRSYNIPSESEIDQAIQEEERQEQEADIFDDEDRY